jgi:hypothetical protein
MFENVQFFSQWHLKIAISAIMTDRALFVTGFQEFYNFVLLIRYRAVLLGTSVKDSKSHTKQMKLRCL